MSKKIISNPSLKPSEVSTRYTSPPLYQKSQPTLSTLEFSSCSPEFLKISPNITTPPGVKSTLEFSSCSPEFLKISPNITTPPGVKSISSTASLFLKTRHSSSSDNLKRKKSNLKNPSVKFPKDNLIEEQILTVDANKVDENKLVTKRHSVDILRRKSKSPQKETSVQFSKDNLIEEDYLTLEQILIRVSADKVDDEDNLATLFFHTFPLFTTIEQMLISIKSIYQESVPSIQKGLLVFMRSWVEGDTDSCHNFLLSDKYILFVNEWLSSKLEEEDMVMGKALKMSIEKMRIEKMRIENQEQPSEDEEKDSPLPFVPMYSLKWMAYNEEWLAATLTIHEYSLFASIPISAFIKQMGGGKSTICPMICKAIMFFNSLSHWVTMTLVKEPRLRKRIEYITKMINLSNQLFALKNFSSLMAIIAGLNHFSIVRMKMTWKKLDQGILKVYQHLEFLMSHISNYSQYRSLLNKCKGPCVPYLGLILADLTFIDNGNLDTVDGKINFAKYVMIGNQLENISNYQNTSYNLADTPMLLLFIPAISDYHDIDDDECEWYSKIMEPADYELTIAQLVEELVQTRKENELLKKRQSVS